MSFRGINFLGKHTYRDFGITISSRSISDPQKKKTKLPIPWSNIEYDFSEIYGDQPYEPRLLRYVFNLFPFGLQSPGHMDVKKTQFINFIMSGIGKHRLEDDDIPGYYFMAEVEEGSIYNKWTDGTLEVEFVAYPFMISKLPEGHDIWDEFNFELDVAQKTTFDLMVSWNTFKSLSIGDEATYGAWATKYMHPDNPAGAGNPINMQMLGQTYPIIEKRSVNQSRSRIAYKLGGINEWLLEQDVIQAQTDFLDFNLINSGISTITPTITTNSKITLVKDGTIYNIMAGSYNDSLFTLCLGDNQIKGYTANVATTLDFDWHKELI